MKYKIILLVVVGLIENCLLTNSINGKYIFPGPQALPWEHNGCGSPFDCFVLALFVVILLRNLLGQRNIGPTTPARTTPTTPARTTPKTLAPITTTPAPACTANYFLYAESCGRFCYRYESSDCQGWFGARNACQAEGGDLLEPSECNYKFFMVRAEQNEGRCYTEIWLGASRPSSGGNVFVTVIGDLISNGDNFWNPGQPDNNRGTENCLEMRKEFNNCLIHDN